MNAMVAVRSNRAGLLSPTQAERKAAVEKVWANTLLKIQQRIEASAKASEAASVNGAKSLGQTQAKSNDTNTATGTLVDQGDELGREAFLQLLVTQMQYQDPMEPMDNEDMIANLAQFSSLEQMTNLNESFEELSASLSAQGLVSASGLIGQTASGTDAAGEDVTGLVERVFMDGGSVNLVIGESVVPLANLYHVGEAPS